MQALASTGVNGRKVGAKMALKVGKVKGRAESRVRLARGLQTWRMESLVGGAWKGVEKKVESGACEVKNGGKELKASLAVWSRSMYLKRGGVVGEWKERGMRKYMSGVAGEGRVEEKKEEVQKPFGATPVSESKQTIDQFRDGMKRDAGRLSMEPEELKKDGKGVQKLSTAGSVQFGAPAASGGAAGGASGSVGGSGKAQAPRKVKKSGRAAILIFIVLGIIGGFLVVGEVGGFIDDFNDSEMRNKDEKEKRKKDWTDISKFGTNVASTLAEWDDKMVDVAMNTTFIKMLREKLGYGDAKVVTDISNRPTDPTFNPPKPSFNKEDEKALMTSATVMQASEDEEEVKKMQQKEESQLEAPVEASKEQVVEAKEEESTLNASKEESKEEVVMETSTQLNESYDTRPVEEDLSSKSSEMGESIESKESKESIESLSSSSTELESKESTTTSEVPTEFVFSEENFNLLKIENEEMRMVLVGMMKEVEEMRKRAEEEKKEAVGAMEEALSTRGKKSREEEAQRVMEILRAYEKKMEEEMEKVAERTSLRESSLRSAYDSSVNTALAQLAAQYEATLGEWSEAMEKHVEKWSSDVLSGPIHQLALSIQSDHLSRFALLQHINNTLQSHEAKLSSYRQVAEESQSFASVAKFWILLQHKLSHSPPNSPFSIQLNDYIAACQQVPQLKSALEHLESSSTVHSTSPSSSSPSPSNSNYLSILVKASQLGIPSEEQLKAEFEEAARSSRASCLAPDNANAFQHSFASLKELFLTSSPISGVASAVTGPDGLTSNLNLKNPLSSSSSSSDSSDSTPSGDSEASSIAKKNWDILQKAEVMVQKGAFGPALDLLSLLQGSPASLMKPWIQSAQTSIFVHASLDFLSLQTANMQFKSSPFLSSSNTTTSPPPPSL